MKIPYLFVAALLLVSCSREILPSDTPAGVEFVVPSIPTVEEDPPTRVSVVPAAGGQTFRWSAVDTVGIFPDTGSQVFFSMASGAGADAASFDGGAWSLRPGSRYDSYYPFSGNMYLDPGRIPVRFTGQRQDGTGSFDGTAFYMCSTGTTSSGGALRFSYDMLNTLLRFDLTLPAGTYTKAVLSADEPLFVREGYFDLARPSIVGERYARSLEVSLDHFTVTGSAAVPVYLSLAPVDLSGKTLTLEVVSAEGRRYTDQVTPSRRYEAGTCYHFTRTMTASSQAQKWFRGDIWPSVSQIPEYDAAQTVPYLQWYAPPASPNGTVALLVGGEDYNAAPDEVRLEAWASDLTARGILCVALMYRTPRGMIHFCRSAWQDGQRALRIIRNAVALDPNFSAYDPDRIGVVGWSAGAHLGLMLATCSTVSSYSPVDAYEALPVACNVNWAILDGTAYATTDGNGAPSTQAGYGPGVTLDPLFQFDAATPSMCLLHREDDPYSPMASTLIYRQLRLRGIPAEVHLFPGGSHDPLPLDRGLEFLTQLGLMGTLFPEEQILARYSSDAARGSLVQENIWPAGQIPSFQAAQNIPYIEWHFPLVKKTDAIQIIYSCGSYMGNDPLSFDVASARRYLNEKGMTVVTLKYRTPRPEGLAKHLSAWQDLQRTVRLVRSKAASYGLDPDRIGIMGASAGGHLTLMGVTSSRRPAYARVDAVDDLSCRVQWGIASCPAYALTDGLGDTPNAHGGNLDEDILAPEFSFDLDTAPMLLMHGDADGYAAMNSVKVWEKLRSMGIPAEVHTFATRPHTFQQSGSPGTGSYNWLERVGEYLEPWF